MDELVFYEHKQPHLDSTKIEIIQKTTGVKIVDFEISDQLLSSISQQQLFHVIMDYVKDPNYKDVIGEELFKLMFKSDDFKYAPPEGYPFGGKKTAKEFKDKLKQVKKDSGPMIKFPQNMTFTLPSAPKDITPVKIMMKDIPSKFVYDFDDQGPIPIPANMTVYEFLKHKKSEDNFEKSSVWKEGKNYGYGFGAANAHSLPGVGKYVIHPISKTQDSLYSIIISLNDKHKWTRDQIADWIETLDVDTTFKTKEEKDKEKIKWNDKSSNIIKIWDDDKKKLDSKKFVW